MILEIFLCAITIFVFAYYDTLGFGVLVQSLNDSKESTRAYRIMQLLFQFETYLVLFSYHHYGALIGFVFTHWSFGCDAAYYWIRKERYQDYVITWFGASLPSLIFKLIGKPFEGKYLTAIGIVSILSGLIIAAWLA